MKRLSKITTYNTAVVSRNLWIDSGYSQKMTHKEYNNILFKVLGKMMNDLLKGNVFKVIFPSLLGELRLKKYHEKNNNKAFMNFTKKKKENKVEYKFDNSHTNGYVVSFDYNLNPRFKDTLSYYNLKVSKKYRKLLSKELKETDLIYKITE